MKARSDGVGGCLAAAVVVGVPLGQAFRVELGEQGLPILWSEIFGVILLLHWTLSRRLSSGRLVPLVLAGGGLFVAGALGPSPVLSLVTTKNLVFGALLGTVLGRHMPPGRAVKALTVSLLVIVGQLMLAIGDLRLVADFHSQANLNWGRSNYVAAVALLGCGVFAVIGRSQARSALALLPAIVVVYLTGSRGSLFALVLGLLVFAFGGGSSRNGVERMTKAILICGLGVVAFVLGSSLWSARSVATNAGSNIAERPALVRASIDEFVASPLVGSGTGGIADSASATSDSGQRYAHSLVPSILQQYGVLGVPWLIVMAVRVVSAWRGDLPISRPWLTAMVVVASVEVVFEGVIGSVVGWWLIERAQGTGSDTVRGPKRPSREYSRPC